MVRVEGSGPVRTVVLDRRGVRNAVDRQTAEALAAAVSNLDQDEEVRAIVLWGAHGTFCAGADLQAFGTERQNRVAPDGDGPMGVTRMETTKPVIAAIAGHAVAGGLEIALWCDLRVVEETAVLGVYCRRWGVPLIDGGTVRLPRIVGMGRALDLILTGRGVDAAEAMSMGLANRVVPDGEARSAAEELAASLVAFPQDCLRNDRASALRAFDGSFGDAMQREFEHGLQSLASDEIGAGVGRFRSGAGRHGTFGDQRSGEEP